MPSMQDSPYSDICDKLKPGVGMRPLLTSVSTTVGIAAASTATRTGRNDSARPRAAAPARFPTSADRPRSSARQMLPPLKSYRRFPQISVTLMLATRCRRSASASSAPLNRDGRPKQSEAAPVSARSRWKARPARPVCDRKGLLQKLTENSVKLIAMQQLPCRFLAGGSEHARQRRDGKAQRRHQPGENSSSAIRLATNAGPRSLRHMTSDKDVRSGFNFFSRG